MPQGILARIRSAFPDSDGFDATDRGQTLNVGVAAAHKVMVKIFEKLPAGVPLTLADIVEAENKIIKAIKHSSLREWLTTVGCHHTDSYRHCLFVTGFAVAFAQHLGMREDDQRRLARAALLHDVGKAFIPVAILDKPGMLSMEEMSEIREHPRLGYDALSAQGGFPPEMLDVILHHHEFLDGTGYPDGLSGNQISDIVRLTTIVDIHAALVEKRAYRLPFTHAKAFARHGADGRQARPAIAAGVPPCGDGDVLRDAVARTRCSASAAKPGPTIDRDLSISSALRREDGVLHASGNELLLLSRERRCGIHHIAADHGQHRPDPADLLDRRGHVVGRQHREIGEFSRLQRAAP